MISVKKAHIHNLKSIDVSIPKGKLTVITGVSGSGKSSLAFDTIYEEGKRRYLQYVGTLLQIDEHQYFEEITGLSPTLAVEQRIIRQSNPRSTVGTRTRINNLLQMLYSIAGRFPCPTCGGPLDEARQCAACGTTHEPYSSSYYSRNSAVGMCYQCLGSGYRSEIEESDVFKDLNLPLKKILQTTPNIFRKLALQLPDFCRAYGVKDTDPCGCLSPAARQAFLYGFSETASSPAAFEGLIAYVRYYGMDKPTSSQLPPIVRAGMGRVVRCAACEGTGLCDVARSTKVLGKHIGELGELPIAELKALLAEGMAGEELIQCTSLVETITQRLQHLMDVGLGYLSLARTTPSLSGGELQRMFLASFLISSLEGVIFIFDEPTIGMHEVEKELLLKKLRQLAASGNTVIVVEHDPRLIAAADHILDLGPGAGAAGGHLLYQGDYAGYLQCEGSISAAYLAGRASLPARKGRLDQAPFPTEHSLALHNVCTHNLKDVSVRIPLGVLVGVAGVSGSGKSSLVFDSLVPVLMEGLHERDEEDDAEEFFSPVRVGGIEGLEQIGRCALISQKPIGRLSTSTPASFIGIYDRIRRCFADTPAAKEKRFPPGYFTVNAEGGCKRCDGKGKRWTHIGSGNFVSRICEACAGTGFLPEVLDVRYQGLTICDVLQTTVSDALTLFKEEEQIRRMLAVLDQIGMGYITLGQPSTTISGGEAQRIKLAKELGKRNTRKTLYVLDEPTTGLSLADTAHLLHVLDELVTRGNTVLITEHDLAMLAFCDYLIELGPGGGNQGGQVIATGTPAQLRQNSASQIGKYL